MGKSSKNKKNKVPKITEEEYVKYLASLKDEGQVRVERKNTGIESAPPANNYVIK